jgi:hypothetical protein
MDQENGRRFENLTNPRSSSCPRETAKVFVSQSHNYWTLDRPVGVTRMSLAGWAVPRPCIQTMDGSRLRRRFPRYFLLLLLLPFRSRQIMGLSVRELPTAWTQNRRRRSASVLALPPLYHRFLSSWAKRTIPPPKFPLASHTTIGHGPGR